MKKDSLHSYQGYPHIIRKIEALDNKRTLWKFNRFISRVDSIFIELAKIKSVRKREFIADAVRTKFEFQLYTDVKLNLTPEMEEKYLKKITRKESEKKFTIEKNIKDEIAGYIKFKTRYLCKPQWTKDRRNPKK